MLQRPPGPLATALLVSAPWLTPVGRDIVGDLVEARGRFGTADAFARSRGLRDRHQLAYALRCSRLPPLLVLTGWIKVLVWVMEYEDGGRSICQSSLLEASDPAYRYRLVKRVTGLPWSSVRTRGLAWMVQEFLDACRPPAPSQVAKQTTA
jgi:hypothetical protein